MIGSNSPSRKALKRQGPSDNVYKLWAKNCVKEKVRVERSRSGGAEVSEVKMDKNMGINISKRASGLVKKSRVGRCRSDRVQIG